MPIKVVLCAVLAAILLSAVGVRAQTEDEQAEAKAKQEKQKQQYERIVNQTLEESAGLRLAENRATIYARIANQLWENNPPRARQLFDLAISELVAAQTEAENDKKYGVHLDGLINGQEPRHTILMTVGGRDAELAFDLMVRSRPAKLVQLLLAPDEKPQTTGSRSHSQHEYIVSSEKSLEQRLAAMIASQKPERTAAILRGNKTLSYESFNLLQQLYQKDPQTANALAAEIVGRLTSSDFDKNNQEFYLATQFLTSLTQETTPDEKTLQVDNQSLRDLAEKVAVFLLRSADNNSGNNAPYLIPTLHKLTPQRAAQLQQKPAYQKELQRQRQNEKAAEFLRKENATPEELLAEASKLEGYNRSQLYSAAANKIAKAGDVNRAKKLLATGLTVEERENALTALDYELINQATAAGKFEEALGIIEQTPPDSRFMLLMQLAYSAGQKEAKENKDFALSVLAKARGLIVEPVETSAEMQRVFQLAAAYVMIEPKTAFEITEPLIPQINELVEASAVIGKFEGGSIIRSGEFTISSGIRYGISEFGGYLRSLSEVDPDRAVKATAGFSRPEVRVMLLLQIVEGLAVSQNAPGNGISVRGRRLTGSGLNRRGQKVIFRGN